MKLDWRKFHLDLGIAVSEWIYANDGNLPSKKSLLDFMTFSSKKSNEQGKD